MSVCVCVVLVSAMACVNSSGKIKLNLAHTPRNCRSLLITLASHALADAHATAYVSMSHTRHTAGLGRELDPTDLGPCCRCCRCCRGGGRKDVDGEDECGAGWIWQEERRQWPQQV